jgi:hypothetical protein
MLHPTQTSFTSRRMQAASSSSSSRRSGDAHLYLTSSEAWHSISRSEALLRRERGAANHVPGLLQAARCDLCWLFVLRHDLKLPSSSLSLSLLLPAKAILTLGGTSPTAYILGTVLYCAVLYQASSSSPVDPSISRAPATTARSHSGRSQRQPQTRGLDPKSKSSSTLSRARLVPALPHTSIHTYIILFCLHCFAATFVKHYLISRPSLLSVLPAAAVCSCSPHLRRAGWCSIVQTDKTSSSAQRSQLPSSLALGNETATHLTATRPPLHNHHYHHHHLRRGLQPQHTSATSKYRNYF